ncbi:MAG: hypothetical protein AB7N24_21980 [Dehalococcoidia bacterium]
MEKEYHRKQSEDERREFNLTVSFPRTALEGLEHADLPTVGGLCREVDQAVRQAGEKMTAALLAPVWTRVQSEIGAIRPSLDWSLTEIQSARDLVDSLLKLVCAFGDQKPEVPRSAGVLADLRRAVEELIRSIDSKDYPDVHSKRSLRDKLNPLLDLCHGRLRGPDGLLYKVTVGGPNCFQYRLPAGGSRGRLEFHSEVIDPV